MTPGEFQPEIGKIAVFILVVITKMGNRTIISSVLGQNLSSDASQTEGSGFSCAGLPKQEDGKSVTRSNKTGEVWETDLNKKRIKFNSVQTGLEKTWFIKRDDHIKLHQKIRWFHELTAHASGRHQQVAVAMSMEQAYGANHRPTESELT